MGRQKYVFQLFSIEAEHAGVRRPGGNVLLQEVEQSGQEVQRRPELHRVGEEVQLPELRHPSLVQS